MLLCFGITSGDIVESNNALFNELEIGQPVRIFFQRGDYNLPPDSIYRDCRVVSKHPEMVPLPTEVIDKLIPKRGNRDVIGRSLKRSNKHRILCSYKEYGGTRDHYLIVPVVSFRLPKIEVRWDVVAADRMRDLV